jgi:predicted transcriptional regulator of viral defense system
MSFRSLRLSVEGEIFDYQMLSHHLREYKKPRDKITLLLKSQSIIRIKKGLYIFGPDTQRKPIPYEILANLIYHPSYISLEYALSKYGIIPERAYGITSVCLSRSKSVRTPVGIFAYKKRALSTYPIGITRVELPREGAYLIATREKALVDLIAEQKTIKTVDEMKKYLYENMRMEQSDLQKFDKKLLSQILKECNMKPMLLKAIYDESDHTELD